jgi:hypothetical protein
MEDTTMYTTLNTPEDLDWLFATHLKDFGNVRNAFIVACLTGNEDCPTAIQCYSTDDYRAAAFRFELMSDGQYHTIGIVRQSQGYGL